MRILITDDHTVVRRGLKQILLSTYPEAQCEEAESGDQAINFISRESWDLLILDLEMTGGSGFDVLFDIMDLKLSVPVLVVSMHSEDIYGAAVIKAGAQGYLVKESAPKKLIDAMHCILSGKQYVNEHTKRRLASTACKAKNGSPTIPNLSKREAAVMKLIFEGHPMKEISYRLELSPKTVTTYRRRILEKFNLTSNAALIQYIIKHKLV